MCQNVTAPFLGGPFPVVASYTITNAEDPFYLPAAMGSSFPITCDVFMVVNQSVANVVYQTQNSTPNDQTGSYKVETGSTIGFSQSVGVTLTAEVGIPIIAHGEISIEAQLGASQDFSEVSSSELHFDIPANSTFTLFEAVAYVTYYVVGLSTSDCFAALFAKYKDDIIKSGVTKSVSGPIS